MAAEDFFQRWSRRKTETDGVQGISAPPEVGQPAPPDPAAGTSVQTPAEPPPLPTMEDVASLTQDSNYASYMGQGVDPEVKRAAMKKLFAEPQFNVMDGLDIYIDDYGKPDPMPPGMLAGLLHARDLLDPLRKFGQAVMTMSDPPPPTERVGAPETATAEADEPGEDAQALITTETDQQTQAPTQIQQQDAVPAIAPPATPTAQHQGNQNQPEEPA